MHVDRSAIWNLPQLNISTEFLQVIIATSRASNSQHIGIALQVYQYPCDNMPRIRTENPELQALVKLQQIVAPLIARSISRDRKIVKSLKVLNSWESLTIEISQLFLYVSEEQALAEEDYRDFQEKLRNVLSLIDDWVDKDLLVTDKATESPSKAGEVSVNTFAVWWTVLLTR